MLCRFAKAYLQNRFLQTDKCSMVQSCALIKESPQDNGVAVYQRKRIHSVYAEPCGVCAMTSQQGTSDKHNAAKQAWQLAGDNA